MIKLSNGCYCSEISVSPKDWDKTGASTKKDWFIYYRFYDPTKKDEKGRVKPVLRNIKGMNSYKLLSERRAACKLLVQNELKMLKEQAYNPVTGSILSLTDLYQEIDPNTQFSEALEIAYNKLKCTSYTKADLKSTKNYFITALRQLRYAELPVNMIKRKHIKIALLQCEKTSTYWSAHKYNKYRTYLRMLFTQLVDDDAIETNPMHDIKKAKPVQKIRLTLTEDERILVDTHLKKINVPFWRFMHIFFHSGARITELLRIRCCHVDLKSQQYLVTVKKGPIVKEVRKTIKDISLHLWEDLLKDGKPDEFIFGKGLKPGPAIIRREQLTRRWDVHVKKKLGIKADLYSLKHLNTSEVVDKLNDEDAAKLNSHTSTAMVRKIYDVKSEKRQHERLKKLGNEFSKMDS